jgi:hypothetical protein
MIFSEIMNIWYGIIESLKTMKATFIIAGSFVGIIMALYFSIFKLGRKHQNIAIIFSTIVSCILMLPLVTSFNQLVTFRIEGAIIDEAKAEIKAKRAEAEKLRNENEISMLTRDKLEAEVTMAKQSIEIEALKASNILLERAKLSMESFQQIAELALTQANFTQTLIRKEPITPVKEGWNIFAEYYYDEIFVVIAHDINAKFGIDLKEVKISKIDEKSVVISGVRPKFIGTNKNISDKVISEIRRNNYKYGVLYSVDRKNDKASIISAENKRMQYESEFQLKVSEGMELAFMDDAIIQLAQNFIKIVFAPLYTNITFDDITRPGALPLMDYLTKELKDNNEERFKLLQINDNINIKIEQIETETARLEDDISKS